MERPNRLTVIAGAVGGLTLVATAVAAVAMSNDTPDAADPSSTVVEQSAPLDSGSVEPDDDDRESATPAPPTESAPPVDTGSSSADAALSSEEAVAIAEQALADVQALPPFSEVERETEHGRMTWKVEFGDDHEVYVDAVTGDVIKVDRDDDDDRDDHHDDDWDDRQDDDRDDDHDGDDDRDDD